MSVIKIFKNEKINTKHAGFNLFIKNANIQTNIWSELKKFNGFKEIPSVYEDLFVLSISVLACDKRFARNDAFDAWTREFDLQVPVLNDQLFNENAKLLNKMLSFLTGDKWGISFYKTEFRAFVKNKCRHNGEDFVYDCVSLFSGGLDSFCGAINSFESEKKCVYVGNKENRLMDRTQKEIFNSVCNNYPNNPSKFYSFNVDIHKMIYDGKPIKSEEKTTRSRSFMFICSALLFSSLSGRNDMRIIVPENGFIGLNLPLTPSRVGSCSTRTTHPYYFFLFNTLLKNLGLKNTITNPFKYKTKREIVNSVEETNAFKCNYHNTLSCSHPSAQRWRGRSSVNENCGKCYPCLIRQSSLCHLTDFEMKEPNNINNIFTPSNKESFDNLYAVLNAVTVYKSSNESQIKSMIRASGYLNKMDVDEYYRVYCETMKDLIRLFKNKDLKALLDDTLY